MLTNTYLFNLFFVYHTIYKPVRATFFRKVLNLGVDVELTLKLCRANRYSDVLYLIYEIYQRSSFSEGEEESDEA